MCCVEDINDIWQQLSLKKLDSNINKGAEANKVNCVVYRPAPPLDMVLVPLPKQSYFDASNVIRYQEWSNVALL